jgi:putative DNA primase/helicase
MNHADAIRQFSDFIHRRTGAVGLDLVADGQLHRFDDPEGRRRNLACWYVLHLDGGKPAGVVGNWRTGEQSTWTASGGRELTPAERARTDALVAAAKAQRAQERGEAQEAARGRALRLWEHAEPATMDHPYLARKRVNGLALRVQGVALLVPLVDTAGNLHNLQTIMPDGRKRFLAGGRITGLFCPLGPAITPETGRVFIAEGVATAATIHAETRGPVVAAMNAGNLKPVALELRRALPDADLVIAADNDHGTPGNPGMTKAREAATAVHAGITWPRLPCGDGCTCTDFNDAANCGWYLR